MASYETHISLKVPEKTYNRITNLKKIYNCSYDEMINKIIEKELMNNYIIDIHDFMFITEKNEYYFRILFRKHDTIIEYLNPEGFIREKKNWIIQGHDKTLFTRFIRKEGSLELLKNMGNSMEFDKFIIVRM